MARTNSPITRRQQEMARLVITQGQIAITDLAERLDVSQMTAYRDADRLAELGIVRRVRGWITAQPSSIYESSLEYRANSFRAEKEAISAACLQLVEPGMSVIIDDGTTLLPLIRSLGETGPLTVMTAFLPAVAELSQVRDVNLVVLGGGYRRHYDAMGGVLCADMISQLRADLFFLCPSAVHDGNALHQDEDMVVTKRAMMESSACRVLVADHSKLGRRATHRLAPVEDFDRIITDDGASPEGLAHILDRGRPVEVVPTRAERSSQSSPKPRD
ncbi:MAG: DeoR/GlpR family DNA-binding transcription regulator [Propionibacteriaceae bacterium]